MGASMGLIEAYWNVNSDKLDVSYAYKLGFNRSILKCKSVKALRGSTTGTRFNRSILKCKCDFLSAIEWTRRRFNRSILKCKLFCRIFKDVN